MNVLKLLRRSLFGLSLFALSVPAVTATQVTAQAVIMIKLESPDGSVSVEGRLLAVENGFYVIETARFNRMLVEADRIKCVSFVCPT